jgi:hypothetical protein
MEDPFTAQISGYPINSNSKYPWTWKKSPQQHPLNPPFVVARFILIAKAL